MYELVPADPQKRKKIKMYLEITVIKKIIE